MPRIDGRKADELRPLVITRHFLKHAEGSVLIELGDTKVVCAASIDERVPQWMRGGGRGWVTAEYGMLPRSTHERSPRETGRPSGRVQEIQRLVGRSLRAAVDLDKVGERTIWLDCDVIQADGGTRTASITGAFVALADALHVLRKTGALAWWPVREFIAATSVGIVGGEAVLDLKYEEDSRARVDMNVVMTESGRIVEVQGTAEGLPFTRQEMQGLLDLADRGVKALVARQRETLADVLATVPR